MRTAYLIQNSRSTPSLTRNIIDVFVAKKMDTALFLLINASENPSPIVLSVALFFSKQLPYFIMAYVIVAYFMANKTGKFSLAFIMVSCLLAALLSWFIGHFFYTPRPFEIGIGHTFLSHKSNASFPSNHAMFMTIFATAFLLLRKRLHSALFVVLALGVAWSRVYLGVHFPLDIAGGALFGIATTLSIWWILKPKLRAIQTLFGP